MKNAGTFQPSPGLSVGVCHSASLRNTDAIHHFKRTFGPSQTNLCATVHVFHAANVFINDLSSHVEHNPEQPLDTAAYCSSV